MFRQIHTYTELRRQIHDDLRLQHPEWVQPNGESPMCDFYEARLMEELDSFRRTGSSESVTAVQRTFRQANVNPFQRKTIPPKSSKVRERDRGPVCELRKGGQQK